MDADSLPDIWYGPCCEKRSATKKKEPDTNNKKLSNTNDPKRVKVVETIVAESSDAIVKANAANITLGKKSSMNNATKPTTKKSENASSSNLIVRSTTTASNTNQTSTNMNINQQQQQQQQQSKNTNSARGHTTTVEKSIIQTAVQHPPQTLTGGTVAQSASNQSLQMPTTAQQPIQSLTGRTAALSANNQSLQMHTTTQQPLQTLIGRTVALSTNNQLVPQCKQPDAPRLSTDKPKAETYRTFRTVTVPPGVYEGSLFHVLIEGGNRMGVICPKGVRSGQTIIVLDPGCCTAPLSAKKIAEINKARLVEGFEKNCANFARRAFWEVLYPILETNGWTYTRETSYNFGAYTFFSGQSLSTQMNRFETISDILKALVSTGCCSDAVRDFYSSIQKQKDAIKSREEQKKKRLQEALIAVPEKRIRIGTSFQVRGLPRAGSYEASSDDG